MIRYCKPIYLCIIFALLYLPLLVLIVFSFNDSRFAMTWHGFTWHWYHMLAQDTLLIHAAWHSVLLAFLAASISVFIASIITTALLRYRFAGRRLLHNLIILLIILPDLVLGITLLILFNAIHLSLGFTSLLIAHITICLPFAILTINSRAVGLDKHLFDAAQDIGASDSLSFRKILLPLLKPAIIAAWLLSFAISLDDILVSFFVNGASFNILPIQIYSMAKTGITPEINALCAIMLGITFVILASLQWVRRCDS